MGSKVGWEKSTSGPDWIDIEGMMRAMSGLHSGHVGVMVSPDGIGFGTGVTVTASIMFELLPGSSLPKTVDVMRSWPCTEHTTLTAHVYALLYELDYKISQVYNQESLWN